MADSMSMGDLMKSVPGWIDHKQAEASQTVGEGLVFDGNARVYEWSDEYGDVVPRVPELEDELFGVPDKRHSRTGLDFSKYVHPISNGHSANSEAESTPLRFRRRDQSRLIPFVRSRRLVFIPSFLRMSNCASTLLPLRFRSSQSQLSSKVTMSLASPKPASHSLSHSFIF